MPTTFDEHSGLQVVPLWIDGASAKSFPPVVFPVFSAAQQKDVYLSQGANPKAAASAAESSAKAFKTWKNSPAAFRRTILLRVADIIRTRQKELIALQMEETSCSESWAQFNINYTLNALPEIASRITTACAGDLPQMATEGTLGLVFKEPIGPVLLIAP